MRKRTIDLKRNEDSWYRKSRHFLLTETIVIKELADELGFSVIIKDCTFRRAPGFTGVLFSFDGCTEGTHGMVSSMEKAEFIINVGGYAIILVAWLALIDRLLT